jgi:SAM-dependent methyltransferase
MVHPEVEKGKARYATQRQEANMHEKKRNASVRKICDHGVAIQVGCGVGNTTFPLAASNPSAKIFSCDYSATAVDILRGSPAFDTGRMHVFVADITKDDLKGHVPQGSVDVVSCIFALSANSPASLPKVRLFAICTRDFLLYQLISCEDSGDCSV